MGFAPTWLRQVSHPPASHDHFNHAYELPELWLLNNPDLIQLTTKYGKHVFLSTGQKQFDKHLIDVRVSVEQIIIGDGIDQ